MIDSCFSATHTHRILDSLVVGQTTQGGADERVVLFVYLPDGVRLDDSLVNAIKTQVRARRTARHVPERIAQVSDVPYTLNGKKVEVPVKKVGIIIRLIRMWHKSPVLINAVISCGMFRSSMVPV